MTRFNAWLAVSLLVFIAACSGRAATPNPSAPGSTGDPSGLPDLSSLPAAHRVADVPDSYTFAPADLVAKDQAFMTGNELVVPKAPLSWAIVGANFGDRTASTLTLTGTLANAYIMASDYATGKWKLVSGPRKTGGQFSLPAGVMRADGNTYIAVLCPNQGVADMSVTVGLTGGTPPVPDVWNVMVWVAGDNNLADEGVLNLNQMESVGSTDTVRILAGYDIDPGQVSGTVSGIDQVHFIKVVHDTNPNSINVGGDPANKSFSRAGYNSASPTKLREFVDWANTNFPAKHSALILWDHGDGWRVGDKNVSSANFSGANAQRYSRAWSHHEDLLRLMGVTRGSSAILADETDGGQDLTNNMLVVNALSGLHFDVIAFDACNMGQIESLYDYRNLADVLVGSEILVPGDGIPYDMMLTSFNAATTKDAPALGQSMVGQYVTHYTQTQDDITFGSFSSAKVDPLITAMHDFATEVTAKAATEGPLVQQAISNAYEPTESDGARDLKGFLTSYRGLTTDTSIQAKIDAIQTALSALTLQFGQFDQTGTTGTAVYLPSGSEFTPDMQTEYSGLNFNTATGWLDMLKAVGVPGGGGGGTYSVQADWAAGDTVKVEWADPNVDVDLYSTEPDSTYWAPWMGPSTNNETFSQDSGDSHMSSEWAKLKPTAMPGDYYIDVTWFDYNGIAPPPTVDVSVKLYDSGMQLKQDLGTCTLVGLDDYQGYAQLHLSN